MAARERKGNEGKGREGTFTDSSWYAKKLSQTEIFTHTEAFTHRNFYTENLYREKFLPTGAFTYRSIYAKKFLYREAV